MTKWHKFPVAQVIECWEEEDERSYGITWSYHANNMYCSQHTNFEEHFLPLNWILA